ncbi:hypothetical protein V6Z12_A12G203500 [Gossypium hirsutum]
MGCVEAQFWPRYKLTQLPQKPKTKPKPNLTLAYYPKLLQETLAPRCAAPSLWPLPCRRRHPLCHHLLHHPSLPPLAPAEKRNKSLAISSGKMDIKAIINPM